MARRELYVQRLAVERERTRVTLEGKRREMEKVRARYLEASKERKVLDKLKERRSSEYYDRQRDEEYKTVDDLTSSAAAVAAAAAAAVVAAKGLGTTGGGESWQSFPKYGPG